MFSIPLSLILGLVITIPKTQADQLLPQDTPTTQQHQTTSSDGNNKTLSTEEKAFEILLKDDSVDINTIYLLLEKYQKKEFSKILYFIYYKTPGLGKSLYYNLAIIFVTMGIVLALTLLSNKYVIPYLLLLSCIVACTIIIYCLYTINNDIYQNEYPGYLFFTDKGLLILTEGQCDKVTHLFYEDVKYIFKEDDELWHIIDNNQFSIQFFVSMLDPDKEEKAYELLKEKVIEANKKVNTR